MKRKLLWSAVALLVSFSFGSCQKDGGEDDVVIVKPGEKTSVGLTVKIGQYSAAGTSTDDVRTSLPDSWLLVFDSRGQNVQADKIDNLKIGEAFSHEVVAGSEMRIVVVANASGESFATSMSYDDFLKRSYSANMATPAAIPLCGQVTATIDTKDQAVDAVTVTRIASVVSFKFSQSGTDYDIESYRLRNVPKKTYFVSQGDNSAWTSDDYSDLAAVEADGQVHTYIVPENLNGAVSGIGSAKDKITDKNAMYVEVIASGENESGVTDAKFVYYFGENTTTDFNVKRNSEYSADVVIDFGDAADKRVSTEFTPAIVKATAANTYMLQPGFVKYLGIPVSRVNEFWGTSQGGNTSANVILNGAGDNGGLVTKWIAKVITADTEAELIDLAVAEGTRSEDHIVIRPKGDGKEGNVIIGIYDATSGTPADDAKPLWSWHIWVTGYNPGGDYNGTIPDIADTYGVAEVAAGKVFRTPGNDAQPVVAAQRGMMDRNLGALSADPADGVKVIGAFYQWGRKDPFFMPQSIADPKTFEVASTIGSAVTKQEAVQNPTSYIAVSGNWLTVNDAELWMPTGYGNNGKTIYDPCPAGWRLYTLGSFLDKDRDEDNTTQVDISVNGMFPGLLLYANKGLNIYFPLASNLAYTGNVSPSNYPTDSYLWNGMQHGGTATQGRYTGLIEPSLIDPYDGPYYAINCDRGVGKSTGAHVRCIKE